ncbi:twin-arginine translocation pathway signal [Nocardia callitridis]|uniref:Twin-arginine translocation pathway signal n=1 Tax=Nocardia callitridis TaxID=648753 RepID=A0ABP9KWI6_9NOCA
MKTENATTTETASVAQDKPTAGRATAVDDAATQPKSTDAPSTVADGPAAPGEADGDSASRTSKGAMRRAAQMLRHNVVPVAISVLVIASVALALTLYFVQYRPDSRTDDAARQAAIKAATDGTVSILSYSPDTLDRDFDSAKTHLTGDFLTYYAQFTQQVVAPAAKDKAVKTTANVVRSAISDLNENSAVVLVFINQTTTSSEKPDPTMAASRVQVSLTKVEDNWRISSFDPV